nr:GGDEF domain-containing protein [Marinicella sp. W31]MDC2876073.1 GGDEF domain-containing protein [Marinicella sp. W31]
MSGLGLHFTIIEGIRELALHDPLTGLPNPMNLNDQVDRARSGTASGPVALLYLDLDLDRFKQVNDTLGHPAGDALMCDFAARLNEIARPDDLVARTGGDEFNVMLCGRGALRKLTASVRP